MNDRTSSPSLRLFICFLFVFFFVCASCIAPVVLAAPGGTPQAAAQGGPKIWLNDAQNVAVTHVGASDVVAPLVSGQAQPLSMISADVDHDGVGDLLAGYSTPNGGTIAVYRGNLDAFAPQSDESFQAIGRGQFPSPFLPEAQVFAVPVRPDFLATGDFTGLGGTDLAVATRGGSTLYIYTNDGKGNFKAGQTINLTGGVTALVAGRFGNVRSALIVGISSGQQSLLAVYGNGKQGLSPLAAVPLKAPASNILFGDFGDSSPDVVFLSGGIVSILRPSSLTPVPVSLPVTVRAFALGSFLFDRNGGSQIAVLASDGSIQIAARSEFDPRVYTAQEFSAIRLASLNRQPPPAFVPARSFPANGWSVVESFPAVSTIASGQTPLFFRTRVSSNGADDIMWLSASTGQMVVVSHADVQTGAQTFVPGQVSVKPYNGSPVAALPMRLNVDGRPGIVALHQGQVVPAMAMPIPDPTFTVNRNDDPTPVSPITNACNGVANDCSLREAVLRANALAGTDTIMVPAGTFTLTIGRVAAPNYDATTGTLNINDSVNIVGAGQNSTIITWGTLTSGLSVDMVMSVNEDIPSATVPTTTTATASISNLTIQNGVNHGTHSNDGDGGCMEFDTGTNGTATLTLTSVTLQNCSTLQGGGAGLVIFNFVTPTGGGGATISNSIIQGNSAVDNPSAADGGGIAVAQDGHLTMTNSQVLNNNAVQVISGQNGSGGGLILFAPQNVSAATAESFIHSSTISGNKSAGFGGGINSNTDLVIDQGTIISGNTAGTNGTSTVAAQEGGGLYANTAVAGGCPGASTCTTTLTKVTITGNTASGNGGGVSNGNASGAGALTMSFSRLEGNTTSGSGTNLNNNHATATVTDNWWGTNAAATTINSINGATTTFDPFIVLTHTGSPQKIRINQSSTLTGNMSADNHGNGAALSGNLDEIVGLPITFDNAPPLGTIPQTQPETLGNPVPTATATFNAGGTAGFGTANATVDQAVVAVNSNLIASATETGTTATITTVGAHGYSTGEFVRISGVGVAGYNSSPATQFFTILSTPTTTTFTYTANASGLGSSSGGTANAGIIILAPPSITKSFNPKTIQTTAGTGTTVSTITFSITNGNGNVVPIDASFTDNLPANVGTVAGSLVVATTPNVVNNCGGSVTATAGAGTISFSNTALAVGTCTIQVNVQSAVDNIYSNSVTIDSTDAGNGNTASDTLTVINPPHIVKAFGAATIPLNGTTSLTFTVSSPDQNLTLSGIAFTDTLPSGLIVATPSNLNSTCTGAASAPAGSSSVSLSTASLAPGTSCTVSVNVTGTTAGVKNNSVSVSDTTAGAGNTSNASITVVAPPSIAKVFNPTSIALNTTTSLQFTITNPSPNTIALTGVGFTDTLPTGLTVASSTTTVCGGTLTTTSPTGISLTGATIAAGGQCQFSVTVTGATAGAYTNTTGAVTSNEGGTGNTASANLTVVAPPSIAKAFNPTQIAQNATTSLTFTITNPNTTVALAGMAFSDTLPTGLTVASSTTTVCGGTLTTTAPTGIALSGATIAAGAQCQFSVTVTGTTAGAYTNTTGAVSSTNGGTGNTATANLSVIAPPSIAKVFNPTTIAQGTTTSLQFTITNPSPNTIALTGVGFTDTLPTGLTVASGTSTVCGGTLTTTSPTGISLTGATVAASGTCQFSVTVTGATAGSYTNTTGAVTSNEGGTGNTASASLTVIAPPSIAKAFNPNSISLNATTSLQFTITNPNTGNSLTGVGFTDTLPTGLTVASSTTTVCGGTLTTTAPTGIALSGATIAASGQCQFSVTVTGTTAGSFTNTTGNVTSTNGGTGNTASANLTVVAPPSIAKVFNPGSIALNATTSLTFTITNPAANTVALAGVAFTDTLPTGLTVASGTTTVCGGTLTTTNPTGISLTGATIAVGGQCQFSVTVTGAVSGQYTNTTGAVTSTNGGTGNTATANLTVASPPSITKSFNPTSIPLNGTSTLSFSITNPNTGVALSGVAFIDSLPSGVQVAAPPSVTGSCGSGTITAVAGSGSISLSGGTLTASPAAGSTCTFSVNVTGTTAGVKNNSVQVTSTEGGTGNTSNATLTVAQASTATAVASSVNPSVFGQPVTFTATVTNSSAGSTGAPTGSVQFVVDGVNFGPPVALTGASSTSSTATSAATATLSVAGSPHTVSANYTNADGNFTNSSGSLAGGQSVTLAITNTAVNSSSNPSVVGQSVTFTATVVDVSAGSIAQPTGSVQFVVDGVNFGPPVTLTGASSNSSAATSQATSTLTIAGSPHTVTANYVNADGNFSNSTNSLTGGQVVTQASTTTAVTPSASTITLGDTVTFTATVTVNSPGTGTPTGLVTFFNGTTPIGSGTLNGSSQATFSTSVLPAGSDSITAIYNGNANFSASPLSSPTTETVNLRGSTTGVVLNPTTVGAGQSSTITVTVTDGGASTPPGTPDSFSPTGAPATGRTGFTSTLFADGLVLVAGGTDASNNVLSSAEIYSVSGGTFSSTGNLNTARTGAVAVLLPNGKVLVAGGSSSATAIVALQTAELFDPVAGTFTPTSQNMTAARFGATATLLNTGKVLIAGGQNSGVLNSAELYDPVADTFTATGNLTTARTGHSATLLGTGKVLVAGGSSNGATNGALNSAELFDPTGNSNAGTFTAIGSALSDFRWQPVAALLLSGKVLLAGGQNSGNGVLTSADLYDPVANSFTASAHQMNQARANGSAVALPNGMVLLPGGTTSQTVDLYDGDSDKFNLTGSLQHHLGGSAATLLNNGDVLVVGLTSDTLASDAELYSPTFNPLGTVGFGSSDVTDVFGTPCVLTPSTTTVSTCTSTVTPGEVGTSPHTITGTYPADAVHSGSSNTASLTVIPTAPPTIAKAFSAANVAQNSTVNVSFTLVNPNAAATLTGISFTDALPAGLVVASPNNLNSNCGGTFTAVSGSSALSLTGGTVAPAGAPPQLSRRRPVRAQTSLSSPVASGQCVISVDLLVTGTGVISNTTGPVSANESGPGNPSNTATINVVLAPTANKAFGAATIPTSGTTSLTFNIANPNTTIGLVGIALNDTLPSGLVVANPNGVTGSCAASSLISANPGGNSISLSALNLAATGSCSFAVNVTGTSGGTKNNTTAPITGTFDDGSGTFRVITGGTASASVVVVAPPVIGKAFVPPAIAPGAVSALTFTITNPAINTVAENGVAFTDTLPAGLVVATPNGVSGSCNGGTVTAVAGSTAISLTGGTVAASSSCIVSVNVTGPTAGSFTNTTGAVSSTNGGTGNTATATLTIANAALSITKTHQGTFHRGQNGAQYFLTVSNAANAGPTVGTVTVVDTLPVIGNPHNLVPVSLAGTGWTCDLPSLTCTRSDALLPGASYPVITFTVNIPQDITNHFTNTATASGGGDPNSHTASDPVNLGPPIDITSTDSGTATVARGNAAVFNFSVDATAINPPPTVVAFTCSGLPTGSACLFTPLAEGQGVSQLTMTVTTLGPNNSFTLPFGKSGPPIYAALLFPVLGLIGIGLRRPAARKTRLRLSLAFAGLIVLLALVGCGGTPHGIPTVTNTGTFTITVTGTAATPQGTAQGSATVTLTVQ